MGQSSNTQGGKFNTKFSRIEVGQIEDKGGSVQVQPSATNDASKGGKDTGKSDGLRDQLDKKGKYISLSAPPKRSIAKSVSGSKFMADAQKSYRNAQADEGMNDKVHIPDSFDESDTDSETLSDKLRKIGAYEGGDQSGSKDGDINDQQHIWHLEENVDLALDTITSKDIDAVKTIDVIPDLVVEANNKNDTVMPTMVSPVVFLPDDHIINTQESTASEINTQPSQQIQDDIGGETQEVDLKSTKGAAQQEKRRSERLKKTIALTTQEKVDTIAKKRNLEGTTKPQTLFSELPLSSLHSIPEKMGINMKDDSNNYFDILKELEIARSNLFIKQQ